MNQPTTVYHDVVTADNNNNEKIGKLCFKSDGLYYYLGDSDGGGGGSEVEEGRRGGGNKVTLVKWDDVKGGTFDEFSLSFHIFRHNGDKYLFRMKNKHDCQRVKEDLTNHFAMIDSTSPSGTSTGNSNSAGTTTPTAAANPTKSPAILSRDNTPAASTRTITGTTTTTAISSNNNVGSSSSSSSSSSAANTTGNSNSAGATTPAAAANPTKGPAILSRDNTPAASTRTITGTTTTTTGITSNNNVGSSSSSTSSSSAANTTGTPSIQKLMEEIEMLKNRVKEAEKQIGIDSNLCVLPWRWIGRGRQQSSNSQKKDEEIGGKDDEGTTFKLPEDVYSILATWNRKSAPFWFSIIVVVGIQMLLSGLLVYDSLRQADKENLLALPVNVELNVRIAQGLAVVVAMICQDDLRVGIQGLFQGLPDRFRGREGFQGITKVRWHLAYMLRFIQGFMTLSASFILLMQADTVISMMLNFLGISFISELDDRVFALGGLGYLGNATQRCTQEISRAEFYRYPKKSPTGKRCSPAWFKKSMHVLGVIAVLIAMLSCYLGFSIKQFKGTYSVSSFEVEFSDETVPYLGLFDGCYHHNGDSGWNRDTAGRVVYTAVSKADSQTSGGKFAFCAGESMWTFYDGTSNHGDECKDYIVKSETTRTFDIIKAGNLQWYTAEDNPLELLKLKKVKQCTPSQIPLDACKRLELQGTVDESRSRFYDPIEPPENADPWDPTLSHEIYVGAVNLEVILFTGRRWVITDAEYLSSSTNTNLTNTSDIKDFFFNNRKSLFNIKDQDKHWISYISEEVSSVQDRLGGTLRGLQWYNPRYDEGATSSRYNFPSADLSNPDDAKFGCAQTTPFTIEYVGCNDVTVRCNEVLHLQTNYDSDQCNQSHVELLHVPPGTRCRLTLVDPSDTADFGVVVYYGDTTKSTAVAIRKTQVQGGEVAWDVPISQCLTEVLSSITVDIFNRTSAAGVAFSRIAADGFSEYQCAIDTEFVKERYVLARLNQSIPFIPATWDVHQCEATYPSSYLSCDENNRIAYISASDQTSSKGGTIPSEIRHLTALRELNLELNDLTGTIPKELGYLTALWHLRLDSNDLTGTIPKELGDLTGLWYLHLSSNDLTGTIPKELGNLTDLDRLYLNSNDLNGTIPKELGDLTALRRLYLNSNDLTGTIPKELGDLTGLWDFYLSSNDLTGTIPKEMANLAGLTSLKLNSNDLTGSIPSELTKLERLQVLSLYNNSLTGSIPKDLGYLTALYELSLSPNDFSGPIPNDLVNLQAWPGLFPNASNDITINIRTNRWPEQTSFEWSKRNESGLWQVADVEKPSESINKINSFTKTVQTETLYKLQVFDGHGNGIFGGWFTMTNSIPSQDFSEGTVFWEASGSVFEDSLVLFIWVDSNGHVQVVEHIPGVGLPLEGDDDGT